jgi:hypothetical protein
VAAECAKQQIYILLDNHISKGMWCCSGTDGNSWWGDTYFHVENWTRGLAYMANHVSRLAQLSEYQLTVTRGNLGLLSPPCPSAMSHESPQTTKP